MGQTVCVSTRPSNASTLALAAPLALASAPLAPAPLALAAALAASLAAPLVFGRRS